MPTPSASTHRYRVLDAWRGICACLVTVSHIPVAHRWQESFTFHNLQLFVDFFFVLSGFVICYAYGETLEQTRNWRGFMIRRFGRIYPLHIAVLAAFFLLEVGKWAASAGAGAGFDGAPFTGPRSFDTLLSNIFLLQSFNLHGMTSWNGPAWSISVEFYTYAAFALAVLAFGARSVVFLALSVLGFVAVAVLSPHYFFTTHDYGFWRCLHGFFLGCLIARFVAAKPPQLQTRNATLLELGAAGLLLTYMLIVQSDAASIPAPLIFGGIVLVFAYERGALSKLLLSAPAQAIGLWSYSIYMIHTLLFTLMKSVMSLIAAKNLLPLSSPVLHPVKLWTLGYTPADIALSAVYLAVVLFFARFTYAWIEAPARAWFSRLASEVPARPAKAAAAF